MGFLGVRGSDSLGGGGQQAVPAWPGRASPANWKRTCAAGQRRARLRAKKSGSPGPLLDRAPWISGEAEPEACTGIKRPYVCWPSLATAAPAQGEG